MGARRRDRVQAIGGNVAALSYPPLPDKACKDRNNFIVDLPRSCTDVICCALFAAFVAAWIVLAVFSYMWGDPQKLVYPTDSLGRICGATTKFYNLSSKPYLFFFDMTECFDYTMVFEGCTTPQVCIEKCPDSYFQFDLWKAESTAKDAGVENIDDLQNRLICRSDFDKVRKIKSYVDAGKYIRQDQCASYYISSLPMAGRCVPAGIVQGWNALQTQELSNISKNINSNMTGKYQSTEATHFVTIVLEAKGYGEKILADLQMAWWQILTGLLLAAIVAFLWIFVMRWIAGFMVWMSILLVVLLLAAACAICWYKYVTLKALNGDDNFKFTLKLTSYFEMTKFWLGLGIIISIIFGLTLLILLFLFSRIRLAVALIVESSRAVSCMASSLFFPVLPFVLHLGVFTFWATIAVYLASSGKPTCRIFTPFDNTSAEAVDSNGSLCSCDDLMQKNASSPYCQFANYTTDPYVVRAQIFNLFGLFWAMFFVSGFADVSLAGAFASYYWAFRKPQDVPNLPVLRSTYRAIRYHLGSIAFGSLILAIVKIIQVMLEYLEKKLKRSDNPIAEGFLKCFKCLFWCLEKFLRFLNKNAYIMVAIYGRNFCASAKEAFSLLMRNVVRVVVLDKCTDFVLFIGKLVITAGAGVGSFYYFSGRIDGTQQLVDNLNYFYMPIVFVTLGAYVICSAFFAVYELAVDTTFLCFLEDCEKNDGSVEKPFYMSKALKELLNKKNQLPQQPQTQIQMK